MGLARVVASRGDMEHLAARSGGGHPVAGAPRPVACLPARARLFPLRLAQGLERALLNEFLYRPYGMYLAIVAAMRAAS